MIKKILLIIPLFIAVILQVSFFPAFSRLSSFNLLLNILIFICIIMDFDKSLLLSLIFGILLDIFSSLNFGIITICFVLTLISVNFLFHALFTNKSLYTLLALGLIGTLIYSSLIYILNYACFMLNLTELNIILNFQYFTDIFWQVVLGAFFLILSFFIYKSVSKKLQSVFIITD